MLPFCNTLLPIFLMACLMASSSSTQPISLDAWGLEPCVNQRFLFYTVSWQEYSLWSLRHREPLDGSQG